MILSADDPWWDEHYPPDGYGCNCFVQPVSSLTMEDLGKVDEDGNIVPDTPPPDAVKKPSVVDGGPIPQRDLEAALERSKRTPATPEPTQVTSNVTSPDTNSAQVSQPISEPLPAEPVTITASGETPVPLTLPEVAQSLPIQSTPASLGNALGSGGNSGEMGGDKGGNGGGNNNDEPQWEDVPEKHFTVWHQAMAAKYKELLPKHFPHGVGKQALAAGWSKDELAKALKYLRKDMPNIRIVMDNLPERIKDALGSNSDSLFFSADSLAKQLYNHPEITATEYRNILGKIRNCNEIYPDGPYHIRLLVENGGIDYRMVLKATQDRREVYFSSLYRQSAKSLKRVKRATMK